MTDVLRRAGEMEDRGEAHVLATVTRVDRPVSAHIGDKAVISADGRLEGWVGGSCSEPIVVREALASLADGKPRLVRIRPPGAAAGPPEPGVVTEVTTCVSEGGVEVFVEPRLPRPRLAIAGSSPAARALARLAGNVGYRVVAVLDEPSEAAPDAHQTIAPAELISAELRAEDAVVVATMSRYDEIALEQALHTRAGYVGLISSAKRGIGVLAMLAAHGFDQDELSRIRTPAGLDLGSSTQEEIALAVLAEVVAERHRLGREGKLEPFCPPEEAVSEAVDPVCGMSVAVVPSALALEYGGGTFYFCSPHCRDTFAADPARYLEAAGER